MVSTRCPPGRNGLPPWTSSGGLTAKGQPGVSQDRPPPKPKKVKKITHINGTLSATKQEKRPEE